MQANHAETDWCKIAEEYVGLTGGCRVFRIVEDTTEFFDIDYGDVILLNDVGYLVKGTESEKKFGLEGEPKPWVKSCVDLITGERKIAKLTFFEEFSCRIEGDKYTCLRNPEKESRILEKMRGHAGFMQGFHVVDAAGNNVRIIDRIPGISIDNLVRSLSGDHESYYYSKLPDILDKFPPVLRALHDLHQKGEIHGDITPDHIFYEFSTDSLVWIDYDYDYKDANNLVARDLLEVGLLLSFILGKEYVSYRDLSGQNIALPRQLEPTDMFAIMPNQIANLKLVYPYIDEELNRILMKFSAGSVERYSTAAEIADDLEEFMQSGW
jgi:hypothetical protein